MKPFSRLLWPLALLVLALTMLLCIGVGSVPVPPGETARILLAALRGRMAEAGVHASIVLSVRLPRVLCAALSGAALSLCGAAMQGLLRNPLADGSTLGVASGASLGAVLALSRGITIPGSARCPGHFAHRSSAR